MHRLLSTVTISLSWRSFCRRRGTSIITYQLSPITYHLSPITYHLPPTTYHLPPTTYHLPPTTQHLAGLTLNSTDRSQTEPPERWDFLKMAFDKTPTIEKHRTNESDTGSAKVQVAVLTERIN